MEHWFCFACAAGFGDITPSNNIFYMAMSVPILCGLGLYAMMAALIMTRYRALAEGIIGCATATHSPTGCTVLVRAHGTLHYTYTYKCCQGCAPARPRPAGPGVYRSQTRAVCSVLHTRSYYCIGGCGSFRCKRSRGARVARAEHAIASAARSASSQDNVPPKWGCRATPRCRSIDTKRTGAAIRSARAIGRGSRGCIARGSRRCSRRSSNRRRTRKWTG